MMRSVVGATVQSVYMVPIMDDSNNNEPTEIAAEENDGLTVQILHEKRKNHLRLKPQRDLDATDLRHVEHRRAHLSELLDQRGLVALAALQHEPQHRRLLLQIAAARAVRRRRHVLRQRKEVRCGCCFRC